MSVNSTKITSGPYVGNDLADTFSYGFKVTDKTELSVYETDNLGVQTLLTVDTDYTVNNVGETSGTVVRVAGALPSGYTWYIRSNYQATQKTTFPSQGPFFPEIHEDAIDKLTYLIQQQQDQLDRSISLSISYTGSIPLVVDNPVAGRVLRWKSDLSGIENFDTDAEYANLSGDTMLAPLAGPYSQKSDDYMPQLQIAEVIDARIESAPGLNPGDFIDYGLVTASVTDTNDYGSI